MIIELSCISRLDLWKAERRKTLHQEAKKAYDETPTERMKAPPTQKDI